MKHKRRVATRTDIKRKVTPRRSPAGKPKLAPVAGPGVPATEMGLGSSLWENEDFAVTQEGLGLRRSGKCIIPKEHLPLVGDVARTLPAEYSDAPFVEAIDHAVMIHFPAEFPNGLKKKREPER